MGVFLSPAVNLPTARSRHRRGTLTVHKFLRDHGGLDDCITTHNKERKSCWQLVTGPVRNNLLTAGKKKQTFMRNHFLTLAI